MQPAACKSTVLLQEALLVVRAILTPFPRDVPGLERIRPTDNCFRARGSQEFFASERKMCQIGLQHEPPNLQHVL